MALDLIREAEYDQALETYAAYPYLLRSGQVLDEASTETDWLVEGLIPAGQITMVIGARGSTKSWLAYDLAIKAARGTPWLGRPLCKSGPVLVLSYDNPPKECGRRFKRLGLEATDPITFHAPDGPQYLRLGCVTDGEHGWQHSDLLRGIIKRTRPVLVVVDSFRQAHTKDENSSNDMQWVMSEIKTWTSAGATVVIVHHAALSAEGSVRSRGSGEIEGSADAVIAVQKGKSTWTKTRSWQPPIEPLAVEFEVTDTSQTTTAVTVVDPFAGVDPALVTACREWIAANPKAPRKDLMAALGGKSSTLNRIAKAIESGL